MEVDGMPKKSLKIGVLPGLLRRAGWVVPKTSAVSDLLLLPLLIVPQAEQQQATGQE